MLYVVFQGESFIFWVYYFDVLLVFCMPLLWLCVLAVALALFRFVVLFFLRERTFNV